MGRRILTFSLFEATTTAGLTQEQEDFLNNYTGGTWSYDSVTGLVDVKGDFDCSSTSNRSSKKIDTLKGIKFGKVSGDFYCYDNSLTSLVGAPQKVRGDFNCNSNSLESLVGAPQKVGGHFGCYNNSLESLAGAPQEVGGDFDCYDNSLTSLAGAPQEVEGSFYCDAFELKKGEWNPKGWLKVFQEGNSVAQSLILTLLSPEALNVEITKDPTGMIMKLKGVLNDESFQETRSKLVWPKGYEKEADLVGDLGGIGF